MRKTLLLSIMLPLLFGCAQMDKPRPGSEAVPPGEWGKLQNDPTLWAEQERHMREHAERLELEAQTLDARARMPSALLSLPDTEVNRYSFSAADLPLRSALQMFARSHKLSILADPDVIGAVSVEFHDLPLRHAMEMLLGSHGYHWEWDESVIRVRNIVSRSFELDYVLLNRTSSSSALAGISSGGGSGDSSAASITQSTTINFWEELKAQLEELISDDGKLVLNRITGVVQVTDNYRNVRQIEMLLGNMRSGMHRQVAIEARIVEVELSDMARIGIDWSRLNLGGDKKLSIGFRGVPETSTINVSDPFANPLQGVFAAHTGNNFIGMLNALQEQGDVRVVSQPRMRTMNNQQALIKVGTDRVFFRREVDTVITGDVVQRDVTYVQQVVHEGLMLSLTPQISADGWVMLDIAPIITRIVGTTQSPDGDTAPELEVKQSSTLVRVRDGEMVLLGGLIQDTSEEGRTQVPGIGDIPLLGHAFRGDNQGKRRTELVIFLEPRIIGGDTSVPRR